MTRLRLGTRSSRLAMIQARKVKAQLENLDKAHQIDIVQIDTLGDKSRHVSLPKLGGGGVFLKEIESALLTETIDFAVHSLKDVPAALPEGLAITAIPEIEDRRDALLSRQGQSLADLPSAALVGTSSIRRAAQLKRLRPDIETTWIRGPIDSRIEQMQAGKFDAIILAVSGLKRLGVDLSLISEYFTLDQMMPAPGQGALAIESRQNDREINEALSVLNDSAREKIIQAERTFLAHFDAGEAGPIGGYAEVEAGKIHFYGRIISAQGIKMLDAEATGDSPIAVADEVAERLIRRGGRQLIEQALKND